VGETKLSALAYELEKAGKAKDAAAIAADTAKLIKNLDAAIKKYS
jgi:hypothetical protein